MGIESQALAWAGLRSVEKATLKPAEWLSMREFGLAHVLPGAREDFGDGLWLPAAIF